MKTNRGWNSNIHCRPLITFCLILMLALSACSNTVKQPVKADKVEQMEELNSTRDGIHILRGVCEVSWRCVAEGPGDWLIEELLRLPMLATGKQGGNPTERLERAVRQAVKSLARDRRYADLSRKKQLEVLAGMVAREYRARLSATLQDSLHEMAEREKSPYGPENSSEHITISSFNIDIVDSWTKGPTFLLEVRASIENGPPTHSRIRCDQCESFPTDADRWTPYEFWNPSVILVGEGRLTVCLEVRAEPYYGNYANTAIACDTIGAPSAQQLEDEKLKAAAINEPGQRCFGAVGNNCGTGEVGELEYGDYCVRHDPVTEPNLAACFINAGSWEHDECCVAKRVGGDAPESEQGSCSPRIATLLGQPYVCRAERNKVAERLLMGLTWVREVDTSIKDRDGTVDFNAYCARPGSIVHRDDVKKYCCSRSGEQVVEHLGDAFTGVRWSCR